MDGEKMKKKAIELIDLKVMDLGDIYLRAIQYEDYKDMFEYGSDSETTKHLSWKLDSLEEAKSVIKIVHLSRPERGLPLAYALICKGNNKMIGTCDYHTIDWETLNGEIGYVINRDYWGKGYMTKACKALIDFGFHYLNLNTVTISHDINNIGSQRVIEKSGFIFLEERIHPKNKTLNRFYSIKKPL